MGFNCINVLLGGNEKSEHVTPTLINSINKNTPRSVHIRILCRGWIRDNFHAGKLKVEFITYDGGVKTPAGHQSSANDKLLYLRHLHDWDRCLVLGWDQLVVAPIEELYDTQFSEGEVITAVPYKSGKFRDLWKWKGLAGKLESIFTEEILDSSGFEGGSHVVDLGSYRRLGMADIFEDTLKEVGGEDHLTLIGVFADKFKGVDYKWNMMSEKMHTKKAGILHFNDGNKPWKADNCKPVWEYFKCSWADLAKLSS